MSINSGKSRKKRMTGRKLYILRAAGLLVAWALLLLLVFLARVWQGERKLREPGA